jgi:hypothetical protein
MAVFTLSLLGENWLLVPLGTGCGEAVREGLRPSEGAYLRRWMRPPGSSLLGRSKHSHNPLTFPRLVPENRSMSFRSYPMLARSSRGHFPPWKFLSPRQRRYW